MTLGTTADAAAPTSPRARLAAVDTLRVIGVVAVMVIHAAPFAHGPARLGAVWDAATLANQAARFAVPMFFVFAGYFWARRGDTPAALASGARTMVPRLVGRFALWSLIFMIPFESDRIFRRFPEGFLRNLQANVTWGATHPGTVLLQGTSGHLWFLMSLAMTVALVALLRRVCTTRTVLLLGAGLFAASLLAGAYRRTALGFALLFNPRNGPGFAVLPVALGCWLAGRTPSPRWATIGLGLLGGGALLAAGELQWLHNHHGTTLAQDLVIGTFSMGVGAALLGLAGPAWLRVPRLAALGPLVLGVYVAHPILVDLLVPLTRRAASPWADLTAILAIALGTLGLVRWLGRWRATRWLVT